MPDHTVGLGEETGNGADKAQTTTTKQTTRGTVTSDPQLVACIRIDKTLAALDENGRAFVLDYIIGKYAGARS